MRRPGGRLPADGPTEAAGHGNSTQKVDPTPTWLSTPMVPSMASTNVWLREGRSRSLHAAFFGVQPIEGNEHPVDHLGRDPVTGVGHSDPHLPFSCAVLPRRPGGRDRTRW